jgi:hypothetical protein
VLAVVPDRRKKLGDVVVVELVANMAPLAPTAHQSEIAQDPQVMRGATEAESGSGRQFLNRQLGQEQLGEKREPRRGTNRLQRCRELLGLVLLEVPVGGAVLGWVGHTGDTSSYEQIFNYMHQTPRPSEV